LEAPIARSVALLPAWFMTALCECKMTSKMTTPIVVEMFGNKKNKHKFKKVKSKGTVSH